MKRHPEALLTETAFRFARLAPIALSAAMFVAAAGGATVQPLVLEPDVSCIPGRKPNVAAVQQAVAVLRNRVHALQPAGVEIRLEGTRRYVITGAKDRAALARLLTRTGNLEIRGLPGKSGGAGVSAMVVQPGVLRFTDAKSRKPLPEAMVVKRSTVVLSARDFQRNAGTGAGNPPRLQVSLTDAARERFARFTSANVGKIILVLVDGRVLSAPRIDSPIADGKLVIAGGFRNAAEAAELANVVNSGPLPLPLRVARK